MITRNHKLRDASTVFVLSKILADFRCLGAAMIAEGWLQAFFSFVRLRISSWLTLKHGLNLRKPGKLPEYCLARYRKVLSLKSAAWRARVRLDPLPHTTIV